VAVKFEEGRFIEARAWAVDKCLLEPGASLDDCEVYPSSGDILLMLDSSWGQVAYFQPVVESWRDAGVRVYTAIYDLLPIKMPQYFVPGGRDWYKAWLDKAIQYSDGFVCISRAVADDLIEYVKANIVRSRPLRFGYWHLGADFMSPSAFSNPAAGRLQSVIVPESFLMVGTIEPRKGHSLALDAMEFLWREGSQFRLCVAGKQGWMVDDLMHRIRSHPELGNRLHFIEKPTDEELAYAYKNAGALLFPTAGEGFGLPIIEAAQFGTPIITTDLPVLSEVAGEHAYYFSRENPAALAAALKDWIARYQVGTIPDSRNIQRLSWEQSTERLLDVVLKNQWYQTSLGQH
jgi:glycosyltransferase involved in cell wall biosynthesis